MLVIMKRLLFIALALLTFGGFGVQVASAEESARLDFFYSDTCPHCHAERKFLDEMEEKYPNLEIQEYEVRASETKSIREEYLQRYHVPKSQWGLVPQTFIGEKYFVGFSEGATSKNIESAIREELDMGGGNASGPRKDEDPEKSQGDLGANVHAAQEYIVNLPFLGTINMQDYSFIPLSIILGVLDGFNVCSLGALAIVLGLALVFKSRKKACIFGLTFLIITAVVYGGLISIWYRLFSILTPYIRTFEFILGIIGVAGGLYFLHEFWKFQKYGVACGSSGSKVITNLSKKLSSVVSQRGAFVVAVGLVAVFAAVVAIVEFPCSAAIPVMYAGLLAKANLSVAGYLGYMAIFLVMYLLDELILFCVAVWTMKIRIGTPKLTAWIVLLEAIILLMLGGWYLV